MDIITWLVQKDPVQDDSGIDRLKVTMWVDTSSLATGIIVQSGKSLVKDVCSLQSTHEDKHINL